MWSTFIKSLIQEIKQKLFPGFFLLNRPNEWIKESNHSLNRPVLIGTGLRFCRSLTWGLEERHLLFLLLHMQHVELVFPPIKIPLLPLIINGIKLITTDYHNTVGFHTGNFKAQISPFQSHVHVLRTHHSSQNARFRFAVKERFFFYLINIHILGKLSTVQV